VLCTLTLLLGQGRGYQVLHSRLTCMALQAVCIRIIRNQLGLVLAVMRVW
jgi:hypothetical protein